MFYMTHLVSSLSYVMLSTANICQYHKLEAIQRWSGNKSSPNPKPVPPAQTDISLGTKRDKRAVSVLVKQLTCCDTKPRKLKQ